MLISERVEGSSAKQGANGVEVTRVFYLTEITGSASGRLLTALKDTRLPRYGDPHPDDTALRVQEINVAPQGPTSAEISCTYRPPSITESSPDSTTGGTGEQSGSITVGATLQSVSRQRDKDNNPLEVSIDIRSTDSAGQQAITVKKQLATVDVQVPLPVIRISRREKYSPFQKALNFVGKVNSGYLYSQPPRAWLMTRIEGNFRDLETGWDVEYELQLARELWDAQLVYIDEGTGQPHEQVVLPGSGRTANGILVARVYPEIDFSTLNLP